MKQTCVLNKKPVREQRVKIRRGTGRVNLRQQSTGIPNFGSLVHFGLVSTPPPDKILVTGLHWMVIRVYI